MVHASDACTWPCHELLAHNMKPLRTHCCRVFVLLFSGVSLTAAPLDLIGRGEFNHKVSVVIGSVRDETAYFQIKIHTPPKLTELGFDALQSALSHGVRLKALKQLYDPAVYEYPKDLGNYSRWFWTNMRIGTDKVPGLGPCGVRSLARQLLKGGAPAVYSYFFTHAPQVAVPGIPGLGPGNPFVVHSSEIQYVMADAHELAPGDETSLAAAMSSYWYTFAVIGDPNHATAPAVWPLFTEQQDEVLRFDEPAAGGIRVQAGVRKLACDFWDSQEGAGGAATTTRGVPRTDASLLTL